MRYLISAVMLAMDWFRQKGLELNRIAEREVEELKKQLAALD